MFETFDQLVDYLAVDVEYGTAWVAACNLWRLLKNNQITDREVVALVEHLRGDADL